MANNKHLSLSDRITIESMLEKHHTFKEIGSFLDKDPTTISKEIRSRFVTLRTGGRYIQYNNCQLRFSCSKKHLCHPCHSSRKFKLCRNCSMCNAFCDEFIPDTCPKHSKPPYVCNGCGKRYTCSLKNICTSLKMLTPGTVHFFQNPAPAFPSQKKKSNT
ncbi:MAG: helix-turn-helix domain-containing protein [Eubacterium sp.]